MESEASPCDLPTCSPTSEPFTPSGIQKERPNLSLNLKAINLRLDCQTSTPGPSTAAILQRIETVVPDLKEIFPHIPESNPHNGTEVSDSQLHTPESTAVTNSSIENLFDECFKNASTRRLHLNVSTSVANKDQSLETPALNLISPMKGPNLLNPKTSNSSLCSINNSISGSDSNNEKGGTILPSRKRGRPRNDVKLACNGQNFSIADDESKRTRDKERNRQASLNYRRNQREWFSEISTRMRSLEDKNVTLEARLATAERKIVHLENVIKLAKIKDLCPEAVQKCAAPMIAPAPPKSDQ